MRWGLKANRVSSFAPGGAALLWAAVPYAGHPVPAPVQLPVRVEFYNVLLCAAVCIGVLCSALLVVALVRTGRKAPPELPEEPAPPAIRTCPECGGAIDRPGERFCINCGARLRG